MKLLSTTFSDSSLFKSHTYILQRSNRTIVCDHSSNQSQVEDSHNKMDDRNFGEQEL